MERKIRMKVQTLKHKDTLAIHKLPSTHIEPLNRKRDEKKNGKGKKKQFLL